MKIEICVPSYRRAQEVLTYRIVPDALFFVHSFEADDYRRNYPDMRIKEIPDDMRGNIATARNFIVDTMNGKVDAFAMLDDDLTRVAYWEDGKRRDAGGEMIWAFVEKYSLLAAELGIRFWGTNLICDKQAYLEYMPFSFKALVVGPVCVHVGRCELRRDESIPLKEDYDFFIQNMERYRRVLRVNKWHYENKRVNFPGGCTLYRSLEDEREQFAMLQKKWGRDIVRRDVNPKNHRSSKFRSHANDINAVIQIPIGGV